MDLPQTIIRASGLNQVGKTTSLNFETVSSINKKKQKAHKEISMIIKIVVDFSTSMRVCSKCHSMLMSQQVLICSVKPSLARRLFFFCPIKIGKSVWFEISSLTVQTLFHYYTYCQVTTQQLSSRHYDREKGVCCGFLHFI